MTADIRTAAQRAIRLDHLLGTFKVGSRDHSWTDEYEELMRREYASMMTLIMNIKSYGIREPILLGSDGRVWDGHHRICAAMHIGIDTVPVEFCTPARVTPSREQIAATLDLEGAQTGECGHEPGDGADCEQCWPLLLRYADAILALMQGQAEGES